MVGKPMLRQIEITMAVASASRLSPSGANSSRRKVSIAILVSGPNKGCRNSCHR